MIESIDEINNALKRMQDEQTKMAKAETIPPEDVSVEPEEKAIENVEKVVNEVVESLPDASPLHIEPQPTQFGAAMETVKLNVLAEASVEDEQFVDKVKKTLKSAAVKHTEVEEKRADLEKQKVDFVSEVLQTEQQKNEYRAIEDKWSNRERKRLYHYNGVKPIMRFVGIEEPLNLFLLYLLTLVLSPFFLLSKLLKGTIGTLIAGASDDDRPKSVKGFLWTLIAVIAVLTIAVVIYLFLKWQGLIY